MQRVNRPDIGWPARWEAETCWHDADDSMQLTVEPKRAVQYLGIGTQMVSPELLTDYNNSGCAWTVFSGLKSTSSERCNAKDRKEIRAHTHAGNPFRCPHSAQRKAATSTIENRNLFETLLVVAPRQKVRSTHGAHSRTVALVCPHNNEPLGFGIGQRPNEDCVNQAEHGRIGTTPNGYCHHGGGCEQRRVAQ